MHHLGLEARSSRSSPWQLHLHTGVVVIASKQAGTHTLVHVYASVPCMLFFPTVF